MPSRSTAALRAATIRPCRTGDVLTAGPHRRRPRAAGSATARPPRARRAVTSGAVSRAASDCAASTRGTLPCVAPRCAPAGRHRRSWTSRCSHRHRRCRSAMVTGRSGGSPERSFSSRMPDAARTWWPRPGSHQRRLPPARPRPRQHAARGPCGATPRPDSPAKGQGQDTGFVSWTLRMIDEPCGADVLALGDWSLTHVVSAAPDGSTAPTVNPSCAIAALASPSVLHT